MLKRCFSLLAALAIMVVASGYAGASDLVARFQALAKTEEGLFRKSQSYCRYALARQNQSDDPEIQFGLLDGKPPRIDMVRNPDFPALLYCESFAHHDAGSWDQTRRTYDRLLLELGQSDIAANRPPAPLRQHLWEASRFYACASLRTGALTMPLALQALDLLEKLFPTKNAIAEFLAKNRPPRLIDPREMRQLYNAVTTALHPGRESSLNVIPATCRPRGYAMPIPDDVWRKMQGKSWHKGVGCPARDRLRLVKVPYLDFAGKSQLGELIIARNAAKDVIDAFAEVYWKGEFRIERMRLVHNYGGDDIRSMNDNNTSSFNCRRVTGGRRLSEHSYGMAIDINPIQNPYVRRGFVSPAKGRPFARESMRRPGTPGVIVANDTVYKAFAKVGWSWGGHWKSLKDYQHFSKSGR